MGGRLIVGLLLVLGFMDPAEAETIGFAGDTLGALPATFETALTGRGRPGRWEVVGDPSAEGGKALAQLSPEATDYHFPLAIYGAARAADLQVTVRFKPVSGRIDQAGGVVVRYQDADNYYITRANALENNVTFYRVVRGNRQEIASARVPVAAAQWHTLALKAEGSRFTVALDGKPALTATDSTFAAAGRVGLWTKADSITHFDRLEIEVIR